MIKGSATLIVDLGNSETRIEVIHGKKNGKPRRRLANIPNSYAEHSDSIVPQDSVAKKSYQFASQGQVAIDSEGRTVIHESDREYVGGAVVGREYGNRRIEPRATHKKYQSLTTLLGLHIAFFKAYELLAEMNSVSPDELDIDWKISLLIPPGDVALGTPELAKIIRSIKKISFTLPYEMEHEIRIVEKGISVFGEGHSAFVGVLFKSATELRDGYDHLLQDNVLVIDIGAGTTDFLVISDGLVIEDTKFTTETGGNNISQSLRAALRKEGKSFTLPEMKRAVMTGKVRDGATELDVIENVTSAKRQVSYILINALQDFFDQTGFSPRSINYLLVVGGGSIKSNVEGIEPISTYLVEQMREYSPNVGLVGIPKTSKVGEDGETITSEVNPRLLNILGAGIQSEG